MLDTNNLWFEMNYHFNFPFFGWFLPSYIDKNFVYELMKDVDSSDPFEKKSLIYLQMPLLNELMIWLVKSHFQDNQWSQT